MDSAIQELVLLVPPPNAPVAARGDWKAVEKSLGLLLPTDYKAVIEIYGSGEFFDFIWVASPFVANPSWSLGRQVRTQADNFRTYASEGFAVPYAAYPDHGGLICFGTTENCNCLSWLPIGPPNAWSLVIWDTDVLTMRAFPDLTLSSLLVKLAGQENLPAPDGPLFPDDLFERIYFTSKDYDTAEFGWVSPP